MLAPVMPYNDFASLTKEAALAIAAYCRRSAIKCRVRSDRRISRMCSS
jgi:hypothetical protein